MGDSNNAKYAEAPSSIARKINDIPIPRVDLSQIVSYLFLYFFDIQLHYPKNQKKKHIKNAFFVFFPKKHFDFNFFFFFLLEFAIFSSSNESKFSGSTN